jgi:hypothetical protein
MGHVPVAEFRIHEDQLAALAHGKGEMDRAALAQVAAENAGLDLK